MSAVPSSVQRRFTLAIGRFILAADALGFGLTFGEAYRPPELAQLYASQGRGIGNSNHTRRLAVDFNVFHEKDYLTQTGALESLGAAWERLDPLARWGGRFGDGDHFSFEWEGVK